MDVPTILALALLLVLPALLAGYRIGVRRAGTGPETRGRGSSPNGAVGGLRGRRLFERDGEGRTPLHHAAAQGLEQEVHAMIFSLPGTGLAPARLALLDVRDHAGLTAADLAERNGHRALAALLRHEQARMEFFE